MTEEYFNKEFNRLKIQFAELQEQAKRIQNRDHEWSELDPLITEQIAIADKMAQLDSEHKAWILEQIEIESENIIQKCINILFGI